MAVCVCQPIAGQPMDLSTNLRTTLALRPATEQAQPEPATRKECRPNYWQPIITRYAADFDRLPVPPRDFVERIRKAKIIKNKKKREQLKIDLQALQRANRKKEIHIPPQKKNGCMRWVLVPTTEKPPEPKPGVPAVTVTDPAGKTWWPKDPNSYITAKEAAAITERVAAQHDGPDGEAHRAAFEEAYRKGLDHKPRGMRPEVLYCCACWDEQAIFGVFGAD